MTVEKNRNNSRDAIAIAAFIAACLLAPAARADEAQLRTEIEKLRAEIAEMREAIHFAVSLTW